MASKKGRSAAQYRREGAYITLHWQWRNSPAYESLDTVARCLLTEFLWLHRADRNGKIGLPVEKAAAKVGVHVNTIRPAFQALIDRGFIEITATHDWRGKLARQYRLTFLPTQGREPTDEWQNYGTSRNPTAKKTVSTLQNLEGHPTKFGGSTPENCQNAEISPKTKKAVA